MVPKAGQETGTLAPPWLVNAQIAMIELWLSKSLKNLPSNAELLDAAANWNESVDRPSLRNHCVRNCHCPGDIPETHAAYDASAQGSPCVVDYRPLVQNQIVLRLASHQSDVEPWVGAWVVAWWAGEGAEIAHPVDRAWFGGRSHSNWKALLHC
jgi:hypothetical protein